MNNFCSNCGTIIPEGSPVCPTCGAPAPAPQQAPTGGSKKGLVGILIAVVAVVLVVVLCVALLGGNSPKSVADDYMKAMFKQQDAGKMLSLIHKDILDAAYEEADMDKDEFEEELQDMMDMMYEGLDDECDEWNVTWEIGDVDDVDDDELEDIQDYYDDDYDVKVKDAKTVEINATVEVTVDDETEEEDTDMEIIVVKIGNKWYLDPESMAAAMY